MRGIHSSKSYTSTARRITPACAGNTHITLSILPRSKDHPRVCGEYILILSEREGEAGSPPRVRGIHFHPPFVRGKSGITPACAGNTLFKSIDDDLFQDHPRVCGEYHKAGHCFGFDLGSPPRVRGIRCARRK